jgi:hypothetical protein
MQNQLLTLTSTFTVDVIPARFKGSGASVASGGYFA